MPPTLEDFLRYIDNLAASVESLLGTELRPDIKAILLRLKTLLKSKAINKLLDDYISKRTIHIPTLNKVKEIGDALDELHIKKLHLPYPDEQFVIKQKEQENAQRATLFIHISGLCGVTFELE